MELPPWASVLAVVLATGPSPGTGTGHAATARRPGPKPCPVIGTFNLLGSLPHRSLDALSKQYGPLMRVQFGSFPLVVASSVDTAKFFLKTHDAVFADRPKMAAGRYTTYNYSNIALCPYGAYWRQARKLCADELFSARRLESFEYIRAEEVRALLRELHAAPAGEPVTIKERLSAMSLNIITRMVLGSKYADGEVASGGGGAGSVAAPKEFRWMLDELFLLNGVLNVGDWIPWLSWLDLQGYAAAARRRPQPRGQAHPGQREGVHSGSSLFPTNSALCQRGARVHANTGFLMAQDLVAAGTESAAVIVEWALSELLKKPETLAAAVDELHRVVGRERWVTGADIPRLPYVEAVVKETLRLHLVAPMLSPRLSREDTSVGGHAIPAGTRVLVNVWTITRDPALWDAPEEFRPERFVGSKIDVKGQDFELLPFGSGRRMCPGYTLGLKVIQVSLANLLHGFAWRLPDGTTKEAPRRI